MVNSRLLKYQERHQESRYDEDIHVPQLSDFKVVSKVGHGGYGEVFKVYYEPTRRYYALKVTRGQYRREREGALLALLKGKPHVVQLIHDFSSAGQSNLVMELSRCSVYDLIKSRGGKSGKLTQLESSVITKQTLQGLDELTRMSIVHGDLKCSNLLIFDKGIIKICDFGNSIIQTNANATAHQKINHDGSIYYLAPELIKNHQNQYNEKSDVWALGGCIFEMIWGEPPFAQFGYAKALHYILNLTNNEPLLKGLKGPCLEFVSKCFQIDTDQRLSVKSLMELEWVQINEKLLKFVELNEEEEDVSDSLLNKFRETDLDSQFIDDDFDGNTLTEFQYCDINKIKSTIPNASYHKLIDCLNSGVDWQEPLHNANTLFKQDMRLLRRFVFAGYLPTILQHPRTKEVEEFTQILLSHKEGPDWFKIAGGNLRNN